MTANRAIADGRRALLANAESILARPQHVADRRGPQAPLTPRLDSAPTLLKTMAFIRAADVIPKSASWAWKGRVAFGTITMLEGSMGTGKTTVTASLIAAITTGDPRGGECPSTPGDALLVSLEDDAATTLTPRLMAAGADLSRVHIFQGFRQGEKFTEEVIDLSQDVERLREAVRAHRARIVVIDPLMAAIGHRIEANSDQDSRSVTALLRNVAEGTGAAIVLVRHLRKAASSAADAGGGSVGWGAACRSVLRTDPDPEQKGGYLLSSVKCSLAERPPTLSYTIAGVEFSGPPIIETARIAWGASSTWTAEALAAVATAGEERSRVEDAQEFLSHLLKDGPKPKKDILNSARGEGIAPATLDRAAVRLHVEKRREGFAGGSMWGLPASFTSPKPHLHHSPQADETEVNEVNEVNGASDAPPLDMAI